MTFTIFLPLQNQNVTVLTGQVAWQRMDLYVRVAA